MNRDDEFQADQQGFKLLARSGYDPFAFITNLQLLNAIAADDSSLALLYKTHPTPEQRLSALASQLDEFSNVSGLLLAERFQKNIYTN